MSGGNDSEFRVKSKAGYPHGTAISVICRIVNILKIDRGKSATPDINFIVSFDDILSAGMRKPAISDEDAKATGIEKGLMRARNAVDHAGKGHSVVWPAPPGAGQ